MKSQEQEEQEAEPASGLWSRESYTISLGHFSYCDLIPRILSHYKPSILNSKSWRRKSNRLSLGEITVPGLSSPGQGHSVVYMVPMLTCGGDFQKKENECEKGRYPKLLLLLKESNIQKY